jgi:hypothetical protein
MLMVDVMTFGGAVVGIGTAVEFVTVGKVVMVHPAGGLGALGESAPAHPTTAGLAERFGDWRTWSVAIVWARTVTPAMSKKTMPPWRAGRILFGVIILRSDSNCT